MERSDEATSPRVIKWLETSVIGLRSNASDAFLRDLISIVINLVIKGGDQRWRLNPILPCVPIG